jgi:predicted 3-demethylubiquinone-9 3-methyltransferase (glyoxalase superfamily)
MKQILNDSDPGRAERAMRAMLSMGKIDLAALHTAADRA